MSEFIEEFWKEAKPEDLLKNRDRIVRVRNGCIGWSAPTKLDGFTLYTDKDKVTWYANGSLYDECQMYDPPEYWLNKPTPNQGYRLLNKFPHEDIAIGDEGWNTRSKKWVTVTNPSSNKQPDEVWFSRRIEEPPVSKTVVCQLRQRLRLDTEFVHHPKVGDIVVFPGGLTVTAIEKGFTLVKHG